MLVLSRRANETVVIGDQIKITVLGTSGNQIRIGIDAPRELAVHREEVQRRRLAREAQAEQAPG